MEYQGTETFVSNPFYDYAGANMTGWWLALLTGAAWLSSATAQFGGAISGLAGGVAGALTKEVAAIKDPIDKTAVFIGFSQCKHVKRIFGVDYDSYKGELDFSKLSLGFFTEEVRVQVNLTALASIVSSRLLKPNGRMIIYLHGFTDDPTKDSYKNISNAFLFKGIKNVLALDASSMISSLYLRSSTMVQFIGEQLGAVLALMVKAGLKASSIHLVGHSLGSHIAGFTGKTFLKLTGFRVGRISGLDPAGPCFADVEPMLRLHKEDADFVDVIHTDAGVYGLDEAVGHVDYYPNRGSEQPKCLFQTCSHSRVWLLYAESVTNPEGFPAVKCDSWKAFQKGDCDNSTVSYMGYASRPGTTGRYYLQTAEDPPYALGVAGITHKNVDGVVRSIRDQIGLWKR